MAKTDVVTAVVKKLPTKALVAVLFLGVALLGYITFILNKAVDQGSPVNVFGFEIGAPAKTAAAPIRIRLDLQFDPAINPKAPGVSVKAISRVGDGTEKSLPLLRKGVDPGGLYVETELPDLQTPVFIEVETPKGVWKTDDFSLARSNLRATKFSPEQP